MQTSAAEPSLYLRDYAPFERRRKPVGATKALRRAERQPQSGGIPTSWQRPADWPVGIVEREAEFIVVWTEHNELFA